MISYSQHGEDVVLARLFDALPSGVWVDVGAGHPVTDSVTKHLSDRGWWGCNLEPDRALLTALEADRPRDRNLGFAASDRPGRATLHVAPVPGRSTLREDLVDSDLGPWTTVEVELTTVAAVLAEQGIERLDLLKVDAEGHEREVLAGADLARVRPRVVLVEATEPGRATPSHALWEPGVVAAGYRCALDDGLNRFYVGGDDEQAIAALGRPANPLDGFVRWTEVQLRQQLVAVDAALARLEDEADGLRRSRSTAPG